MKSVYLGLAIHNHQPTDNFPHVFELAYRHAYLPLVEALERHAGVHLSLHYSGCLLDWLRENEPDFLRRIAGLVGRGQVEIMTGGYYEPILPIIPDADKLGQIAKLTSAIRDEFNFSPTGLWLAERVWEPQLPKPLAEAGVEWTVVDDNHFIMAGLKYDDLCGYHVTEEEGHPLKVFASSKVLRYSIPWLKVEQVIEHLRSRATEDGDKIVVMGDDGEKFGIWPQTYKYCWEDGWVEDFLNAVEENSSWLKTIPLGEYVQRHGPIGMVYLPTASYAEMQEWALPASSSYEFSQLVKQLEADGHHEIVRYMHAGFWRYFLAKYPEINVMHKKMLRVHRAVYQARGMTEGDAGMDELWKGQCNCPYWHGVFGGVYLNHLRQGIYSHLIAAESAADEVLHEGQPWIKWEMADFDSDGVEELLIEGEAQNLYLDLADGASLFEWDVRRLKHNLGAVMTRRPEAYHQALIEAECKHAGRLERPADEVRTIHEVVRAKQEGLDQHLHYDWYRRASLIDHFLGAGTTIEDFLRNSYEETGDFVNKPYEPTVQGVEGGLTVRLKRDGHVWFDGSFLPLQVEKVLDIEAADEKVRVEYRLTNMTDAPLASVFASEWNLSLTEAGHRKHCHYTASAWRGERRRLAEIQDVSDVENIYITDPVLGLALCLTVGQPVRLWRFPIETISNSEKGFERTFQGSCLLLIWTLELEPWEKWGVGLTWQRISF
ncbi:MAG TPA: alpha-amylase/4-alpha-glucanotransferase domain-containing protein [Dehalococcoidia bacterium]|nr:alpha-amylase/4-alpha-glucanotransferase domain-containing protein [Dehalococcoidia bacterium]